MSRHKRHIHLKHRPVTLRRFLAIMLAAALVAVSCGNDDDGGAAVTDEPATTAEDDPGEAAAPEPEATEAAAPEPEDSEETAPEPEATEAAAPEPEDSVGQEEPVEEDSGGVDPSLDPVKIAFISNWDIPTLGISTPEKLVAAEVAVEAINARGGINGAAIELFSCNVPNDAASADACARDAVDRGVVAIAGMSTPTNGNAMAIFEEAGIPVVGAALEPTVWGSPVAYSMTQGTPGLFVGQAIELANQGATNVRFVITDFGPTVAGPLTFFGIGAAQMGLTVHDEVLVPPDQVDMAPVVQSAIADDVDGIIYLLAAPPAILGFERAVLQAGFDGSLITSDGPLDPETAAQLSRDTLVASLVTLDSTGGRRYLAEVDEFSPGSIATPFSGIGWLAINLIADFAVDLEEVTSESLIEAMSAATEVDLYGMALNADFNSPIPPLAAQGADRIVQRAIAIATPNEDGLLLNGQLVVVFPD